MYLEEKSIVCTTFNVCLICRASIKLRVCLSFMSWRKQSGFYLSERHFKDLSSCYQVKLNWPLNAVFSNCSNIFPLHMDGSEHVRMCKRNWSPYIRSSSPMHFLWMVGFRRGAFIRESRAFTGNRSGRYTLRSGSPLWFLSSSGQHEWTEHCGCPGERELHLNFWVPYPNSTSYKV